tara:strand:+ start:3670 stop:4173 length:504 start_codon:yes stop_codon:yes gene_type:complete
MKYLKIFEDNDDLDQRRVFSMISSYCDTLRRTTGKSCEKILGKNVEYNFYESELWSGNEILSEHIPDSIHWGKTNNFYKYIIYNGGLKECDILFRVGFDLDEYDTSNESIIDFTSKLTKLLELFDKQKYTIYQFQIDQKNYSAEVVLKFELKNIINTVDDVFKKINK